MGIDLWTHVYLSGVKHAGLRVLVPLESIGLYQSRKKEVEGHRRKLTCLVE